MICSVPNCGQQTRSVHHQICDDCTNEILARDQYPVETDWFATYLIVGGLALLGGMVILYLFGPTP